MSALYTTRARSIQENPIPMILEIRSCLQDRSRWPKNAFLGLTP